MELSVAKENNSASAKTIIIIHVRIFWTLLVLHKIMVILFFSYDL